MLKDLLKMEKAPIVEVFESIQGEGRNIGKPSIFVRFWGCNLRCRFKGENCDTPYAVNKEKEKVKNYTSDELITKLKTFETQHIVFTGGEPMLYQDFINEVLQKIYENKVYFSSEIETNGTIPIKYNNKTPIISFSEFNISVKLKSSNQENDKYDKLRIKHSALKTFTIHKSSFKFVYTCKDDINEILYLHKKYPNITVYLMPEGMTRKEIIKHSPEVANICIKHNFKFSPREHIMIWDNKRGI